MHDNGLCSDYLALNNIHVIWESLKKGEDTDAAEYIHKHSLDEQSLERITRELENLYFLKF